VSRRYEVVVIGGGQAGAVIGYFLAQQARDFTVLGGHRAGGSLAREVREAAAGVSEWRYARAACAPLAARTG
jgi:glycine/D-amino acid oxidase-like deaminating enzyme